MLELDDVIRELRDVGIRRLPEAGDAGDRRVREMLEAETTHGHRRPGSPRRGARIWRADRIMHPGRLALAGGIAAVALAIGGVFGLRGAGNPPSALAAEMTHLGQLAASHDSIGVPGPGQYLYTEKVNPGTFVGNWASCQISLTEEDQMWIAADGSGVLRKSYSNLRFASPAAKAACARHGVTDPNYPTAPGGPLTGGNNTRFRAGSLSQQTEDWKSFSTDPSTLLQQVHQKDGGPDTPAEWFTNVADFMHDTDAPPAILAALYQATALIPGVRSLGMQTTPDGQTGPAVAFYANGKPTHELVFDQQTGRLLAEVYYNDDGSAAWRDVQVEKIVDSIPPMQGQPG
ncbi:MAG TPA: CU044_5270 family protein [Solirubrobacteraceae bacterium]|jgi:hypothetical protein|nr:CU044_5270 family protein [Solirubrobacteraceae bacterium]